MKKQLFNLFIALFLLAGIGPVAAQGTAFTYQGRVLDYGSLANGTYDLRFTLYDAASLGNVVSSPVTNSALAVSNGLFTATLDFGAVFTGSSYWLEIGVRTNGDEAFGILTQRQPITPTPYAIYAATAGTATVAGSVAAANIVGTLALAQLPANFITNGTNGINGTNGVNGINGLNGTNGLNGATGPAGPLLPNVALVDTNQIFAGTNIFSGVLLATNAANVFAGNGVALTNVPGTLTWQAVSGTTQQAVANTGYVVTNDSALVTITLPASPNVGDIVRVSGVGAGGWQILLNAGQSILGITSSWLPAGTNSYWYAQTNAGINRNWMAVASSSDGSKLVAVVASGQIYTSTDSGATWTPRDSSRSWLLVASSSDGSKLVAAVNGGQIYTSTDSGVTWTAQISGSRSWIAVASSSDGNKLVAAVNGGQIYTSTDSGVTWTAQISGSRNWMAVASSSDGSKLVAAVGNGQIYTSTDSGVTWTAQNSGSGNWRSVASSSDGNKLVAVVNGGQIYTSTDSGVTWTPRDSSRSWLLVASSSDGSKLVAAVNGGGIYTQPNSGVKFGYYQAGQFTALELQYVGNNQFFLLSWLGTVTLH